MRSSTYVGKEADAQKVFTAALCTLKDLHSPMQYPDGSPILGLIGIHFYAIPLHFFHCLARTWKKLVTFGNGKCTRETLRLTNKRRFDDDSTLRLSNEIEKDEWERFITLLGETTLRDHAWFSMTRELSPTDYARQVELVSLIQKFFGAPCPYYTTPVQQDWLKAFEQTYDQVERYEFFTYSIRRDAALQNLIDTVLAKISELVTEFTNSERRRRSGLRVEISPDGEGPAVESGSYYVSLGLLRDLQGYLILADRFGLHYQDLLHDQICKDLAKIRAAAVAAAAAVAEAVPEVNYAMIVEACDHVIEMRTNVPSSQITTVEEWNHRSGRLL